MSELIVCLNPVIQKTMIMKIFEKDSVNRAVKSQWNCSGKGVNVCRVMNQLHQNNILLTQSNGQHKEWFEILCKQDEVHLKTIPIRGIRFCTTVLCNGVSTELVEEVIPVIKIGEDPNEMIIKAFKEVVNEQNIKYIVFTGSTAPRISIDIFRQMIIAIEDKEILIIADIRRNNLKEVLQLKEYYKQIIIKPNNFEFIETFGKDVEEEGRKLSKEGITIIITQ